MSRVVNNCPDSSWQKCVMTTIVVILAPAEYRHFYPTTRS